MHLHGTVAHCYGFSGTAIDGYNGWFVYNHLVVYHNQGICGTEVNC
jgi:hypothetical protein